MATKKIYGGSSVGPLLYDDSIALDDPDGDFAGADYHALVTDGQLWVEQAPTLDQHVVRKVDMTSFYINVKDYGAVGDGSTDDATAINNAIAAAKAAGGGVVFFPVGNYRVASTINVTGSTGRYITLMGEGEQASKITADLSLTPVIQFGDAAGTNIAYSCGLRDLYISRAAGTVPAGSIGVLWLWFEDGRQYNCFIERHAYCEKFTYKDSTSNSGRFRSYGNQYANAVTAYWWQEYAVDIQATSDFFGLRSGAESYTPSACIKVTGSANGNRFTDCTFIPLGTANTTDIFSLESAKDSNYFHDYQIKECYAENVRYFFSSDATVAKMNAFEVTGGRFATVSGVFNLNAATNVIASRFVGANLYHIVVSDLQWVVIIGCFISGGTSTITGSGADNSASITGNVFASNLVVAGTWGELSVVGNTCDGCKITDSVSAGPPTVIIAGNAQGAATQTAKKLGTWATGKTINTTYTENVDGFVIATVVCGGAGYIGTVTVWSPVASAIAAAGA